MSVTMSPLSINRLILRKLNLIFAGAVMVEHCGSSLYQVTLGNLGMFSDVAGHNRR